MEGKVSALLRDLLPFEKLDDEAVEASWRRGFKSL
jgi:hypothetical protein